MSVCWGGVCAATKAAGDAQTHNNGQSDDIAIDDMTALELEDYFCYCNEASNEWRGMVVGVQQTGKHWVNDDGGDDEATWNTFSEQTSDTADGEAAFKCHVFRLHYDNYHFNHLGGVAECTDEAVAALSPSAASDQVLIAVALVPGKAAMSDDCVNVCQHRTHFRSVYDSSNKGTGARKANNGWRMRVQ